jgi:hypothetical protein
MGRLDILRELFATGPWLRPALYPAEQLHRLGYGQTLDIYLVMSGGSGIFNRFYARACVDPKVSTMVSQGAGDGNITLLSTRKDGFHG